MRWRFCIRTAAATQPLAPGPAGSDSAARLLRAPQEAVPKNLRHSVVDRPRTRAHPQEDGRLERPGRRHILPGNSRGISFAVATDLSVRENINVVPFSMQEPNILQEVRENSSAGHLSVHLDPSGASDIPFSIERQS